MVTVTMLNERSIDPDLATRINSTLSYQMGVPMKHVPNVVVDIEYDYDDEGFAIRVRGIPAHRSEVTGRVTIHARVSKSLNRQVNEFIETARRQQRRAGVLRDIPLTYDVPPPDFLNAA